MKSLFTLLITLLSFQFLVAQHESLFDDMEVLGAFGGPIVEMSSINGQVTADVGGGGAIIFDKFFFGGYGMGTKFPQYEIPKGELYEGMYDIKFGHGGLWFGYTHNTHKIAHFYSSLKLGWGKARLKMDGDNIFSDRHFALTPEIGFEMNVADFFKIGFTGGYRWVNGINTLPGISDEDFNSFTGIITLRFGGFWNDWEDWDEWDD